VSGHRAHAVAVIVAGADDRLVSGHIADARRIGIEDSAAVHQPHRRITTGVAPRNVALAVAVAVEVVGIGSRQHRERGGVGLGADISGGPGPERDLIKVPGCPEPPGLGQGYGGRPKSATQRCSRNLVRVRGCPSCRADILIRLGRRCWPMISAPIECACLFRSSRNNFVLFLLFLGSEGGHRRNLVMSMRGSCMKKPADCLQAAEQIRDSAERGARS